MLACNDTLTAKMQDKIYEVLAEQDAEAVAAMSASASAVAPSLKWHCIVVDCSRGHVPR